MAAEGRLERMAAASAHDTTEPGLFPVGRPVYIPTDPGGIGCPVRLVTLDVWSMVTTRSYSLVWPPLAQSVAT